MQIFVLQTQSNREIMESPHRDPKWTARLALSWSPLECSPVHSFVVDGKPLNVNVNPCMTSWSFPDCSGLSLALDLRRKEMSVTLETVEGGRFFFHATTWSTCSMWLGTYRERCMRILFVMRGNNKRNKKKIMAASTLVVGMKHFDSKSWRRFEEFQNHFSVKSKEYVA